MKKRRTPTAMTWMAMRARCSNKNNSRYQYYGGRGIKVCERWSSYANFLSDMGERPEGKTIDRIDNDGDYEPWNCRWSTPREQRHNQRKYCNYSDVNMLTHDGITKSVSEWAKHAGLNRLTLRWRLNNGWPPGEALGLKPHLGNKDLRKRRERAT